MRMHWRYHSLALSYQHINSKGWLASCVISLKQNVWILSPKRQINLISLSAWFFTDVISSVLLLSVTLLVPNLCIYTVAKRCHCCACGCPVTSMPRSSSSGMQFFHGQFMWQGLSVIHMIYPMFQPSGKWHCFNTDLDMARFSIFGGLQYKDTIMSTDIGILIIETRQSHDSVTYVRRIPMHGKIVFMLKQDPVNINSLKPSDAYMRQ